MRRHDVMRDGMRRYAVMRYAVVTLVLLGISARVPAQEPDTHLVIISGLSGEERFAQSFTQSGAAIANAAITKYGVPRSNVVWLAEAKDAHALVSDVASKANVQAALQRIAQHAGEQDRVLVVLFGHGSFQAGESRINLPGPDITGKELAALLQPLSSQRVAVVNTSSASGGFVQDLAAPNRVIITATKSGMEANETVFGQYFATALAGDEADTDKDGRVSLLEAFDYARGEVQREYQRGNKLLTEHALLDGVGDGKGVAQAEAASPHARAARTFYLGVRTTTASGKPVTPALRALYDERTRLQSALDDLRARKDTLPEKEYETALEKLLVDLSLNAQAIRRAEGSTP